LKTAEAKVLTTEVAIQATNKLFELAGTRSTLAQHNFDRHWRNARAHTLHDPVRWKYFPYRELLPERHSGAAPSLELIFWRGRPFCEGARPCPDDCATYIKFIHMIDGGSDD
jgi:hypothetical protein